MNFNTRFRDNQRLTWLGLVFSSDGLLLNSIEQLSPLGKSDHMSITFNIDCETQNNKYCSVNYAYDRGNYSAMNGELSNTDWESEFRGTCLNDKWTLLKDKIHRSVRTHIPERKTYSNNSKHKPLWMTRTAFKAVKKKHRSWKKYLETR